MDEYCGYKTEDVHSGTELDEIMCEMCGTIQPATNKFCSHCGKKLSKSGENSVETGKGKKIFVPIVICLGVASAVISFIIGFSKEKIAAEKSYEIAVGDEEIEVPEIEIPDIEFEDIEVPDFEMPEVVNGTADLDGEYVVGKDFPAGEYLLYVEDCFDDSMGYDYGYIGTFEYYSWFQNSIYVDLLEGEYADISGCRVYSLSEPLAENNPFEKAGMFKVGFDLEPGTYTVIPDGSGFQPYVNVHENCRDYDRETFDNSTSPLEEDYEEETVTVKEGEYLELRFCKLKD